METSHGLSGFLRARRELLKPADVGLPDSERRRVEGLRREEVAMLAGISTEYYLRLEQGRDHQPSDQVLDGLARALQLDEPPDRELVELIGELCIASKRFAALWVRHDVKHRSTGPTVFDHPQVGPLDLHYTILHLPEQRQMVVTYHADPGSPSEEGLRLLTSLTT
jgi:transcriptional regulator with XRE-family HTH domain